MNYPCLVPKQFCKTPIQVKIESEEIDNLGQPKCHVITTVCNYQEKAKSILTKDKKVVQVTGIALFCGDIAPDTPTISGGTAILFGMERKIEIGEKARNPDGTVNYCRLYFI